MQLAHHANTYVMYSAINGPSVGFFHDGGFLIEPPVGTGCPLSGRSLLGSSS